MKTRIVHVSKLQNAKVMAVFYLIISIPLTLASLLPVLATGQPVSRLIWLMPVLYTVIGFVFTFLGSWIYNGVAKLIGGIEFTLSQPLDE